MRMILVLWLVALCPLAAKQRLDRIPLYFEQKGPGSFVVNSGGSTLTLDRQGIHLSSIHMSIAHASRHATIEGEQLLAAPVTRFNGKQMSRSQVFERVRYRSIRPGVDLIFHGANGLLEYDFIIAPGANPEDLRFQLDPSSIASIDESGELNIVHGTPRALPGTLAWKRPVVYERESGKPVTGRFLLDRNEIGFAIGPYDRTQTLIIDPVLNYVTYLGSTGNEIGRVAADDQGNFYLAGSSTSQDLPVTAASFQPAFAGRTGNLITGDVFVAKFSAAGALTWLTYVGGKGDEYASGVAVDAQGNVLVTGFTNSRDFPLKNAAQSSYGGQGTNSFVPFGDAFLSKLTVSRKTKKNIFSTLKLILKQGRAWGNLRENIWESAKKIGKSETEVRAFTDAEVEVIVLSCLFFGGLSFLRQDKQVEPAPVSGGLSFLRQDKQIEPASVTFLISCAM